MSQSVSQSSLANAQLKLLTNEMHRTEPALEVLSKGPTRSCLETLNMDGRGLPVWGMV